MAREQKPHGAFADFDVQRRSTKFREGPATREIHSHREWFLAPDETGACLNDLTNYAAVTYASRRNRGTSKDPKQRTIELVQGALESWMDENPPDDFTGPDLTEWVRARLRILRHAQAWGDSQRHFREGERTGETRRTIAGDVLLVANRAIERLSTFLNDDGSNDRIGEKAQGTLFT